MNKTTSLASDSTQWSGAEYLRDLFGRDPGQTRIRLPLLQSLRLLETKSYHKMLPLIQMYTFTSKPSCRDKR